MSPGAPRRAMLALAAAASPLAAAGAAPAEALRGPLRVCRRNPRYFETADGRPLLLAGSHSWNTVQDFSDPPEPFGFARFLDLLSEGGHGVTRLWRREGSRTGRGHAVHPQPWLRTGPGAALDGLPRYDLTRFDLAFFDRLRARVRAAAARGIVPVVMLFEGFGMEEHDYGDPWPWHPMNAANNVNGLDGDPDRQGHGRMLTSLRLPGALAVQETFVRRCVAALSDCDTLLWEVANEIRLSDDSIAWTRHMVRLLRRAQEGARWRHPVGVTAPYPDQLPEPVMHAFTAESGADWVSPHGWNRYQDDPPAATGRQISIVDTDHTFGVGGDAAWVWKMVTRGHNVLVMDSLASRDEITGRAMPLPAPGRGGGQRAARRRPACGWRRRRWSLARVGAGRAPVLHRLRAGLAGAAVPGLRAGGRQAAAAGPLGGGADDGWSRAGSRWSGRSAA